VGGITFGSGWTVKLREMEEPRCPDSGYWRVRVVAIRPVDRWRWPEWNPPTSLLPHLGRRAALRPGGRARIIDAGYDSMPLILHEVQARYPDLVIHQVEVSVPEQYQQLLDGRAPLIRCRKYPLPGR
jgi:hypothetical protein